MDLLILVMAIKGKEISKDFVMELDQSHGKMDLVMKVSGFKVIVMVTEFTDKNLVKNIVVNGNKMFVTAKVNGLMQTEESYLETLEMINVTVYVLISLLKVMKLN
jgi:hypothetical protein